MDNATAEYAFQQAFFVQESFQTPAEPDRSILSPTEFTSTVGSDSGDARAPSASNSIHSISGAFQNAAKEEQSTIDTLWKQVFDPVLEYIQTFAKSTIDPAPPIISLLIMIRITEDVAAEVENRMCPAVSTYLFALRMQFWPVFQKAMSDHIESVKKLTEGTAASYFSRGSTLSQDVVLGVSFLIFGLLCNLYLLCSDLQALCCNFQFIHDAD
jgi:vacuolar protein sorting-associated protein 52